MINHDLFNWKENESGFEMVNKNLFCSTFSVVEEINYDYNRAVCYLFHLFIHIHNLLVLIASGVCAVTVINSFYIKIRYII